MSQHDELEEALPTLRGRDLLFALAVILTLVAMAGVAIFFAVQLTTQKTEATATTSPSASPATSIATSTTSPTFMATPVAMKVCTDIPDGRLHVRFAAGDGSEVRGYLTEGESIQVALDPAGGLDSQIIKGNLWLRISSPVAGWVNAVYICEVQKK